MSDDGIVYSTFHAPKTDKLSRLVRAGFLTGVIDGMFASVVQVAWNHSTVARLFQGVASTVVGKEAHNGGANTVFLGVFMHFCVAFAWSAVFLFLALRWSWIRTVLGSRFGLLKVASAYGPLIFLTMSTIVIPLLVRRPPAIGSGWWIQLIGHIPFVGFPIVASIGRDLPATRVRP